MAETITSLIDALAEKMKTVSEQGAALVEVFKEQAAALDGMKASAEKAAEELKNLGAAGPVYNNTDNVAPWDINTKVDNETVNQQNTTANYAQAAIDSGSATNMQNAIDSLNKRIEGYQKNIIDPAKTQLIAAQQSGNTAKALEITKNITGATAMVENIKMQIGRIESAKNALPSTGGATTKTYRLEVTSASGQKSYIETTEENLAALLQALGKSARLV